MPRRAANRLKCTDAPSHSPPIPTVKFVADRPFADPETAARKLLDIVRASIADSGLPHAYTGVTNTLFLRAKRAPAAIQQISTLTCFC